MSCEAQVSARGGRDGSSAKIEHGQGGGVTEGHMEPQRRGANISRMPGDACYKTFRLHISEISANYSNYAAGQDIWTCCVPKSLESAHAVCVRVTLVC